MGIVFVSMDRFCVLTVLQSKIGWGAERCVPTLLRGSYIKLFQVVLITALLFPAKVQARVQAHEIDQEKIEYYEQETLTRPSEEVIEQLAEKYETAQAQLKVAREGYGGSCVTFAKKYLGLSGTWGNGGSRLSLNSGPVVGAVVIFYRTHVAVVIAISGQNLTIIESNYDYRGHIRTRVISAQDSSIKGFHKF